MFQACRPAGRLFYWVLAGWWRHRASGLAAREVSARKRRSRLFPPEAKRMREEPATRAASPTPQSGPTLTSVVDTVYTADGTPAQGVLIITWPAFVTASGAAVAAGNLNVTLGANGALNVGLVANAGATLGCVLHRGLSVGTWGGANGNLGGASDFSGYAGGGADDAGRGKRGSAGVCAIRELGASGESE